VPGEKNERSKISVAVVLTFRERVVDERQSQRKPTVGRVMTKERE
jgi:hypothetical protein